MKRATSPPPTRHSASASMYCAVLAPASARAAVSLSRASIVAGARGIYGIGSGNELSQRGTISDRHGIKPLIIRARPRSSHGEFASTDDLTV